MATSFFSSWALWEKLCFVLACGIVLTIIAGCVKLIYKHFELRRHTAIAASQVEEQQMQQASSVPATGAPDIPFGVRAIENGIEVEGVWISRSNTPVSSNQGSPVSSPIGDTSPTQSEPYAQNTTSIPKLVMPQPMSPYSGRPGSSSTSPSRSPNRQHEKSIAADRFSSLGGVSPDTIKIRIRPSYQPRQSSHLRFSSGDIFDSLTVPDEKDHQQEGSALSSYADTDTYTMSIEQRKTQHTSRTSLDSDRNLPYYTPQRLGHMSTSSSVYSSSIFQSTIDQAPFSRHSIGDMDSLASHRRSHAAEIGQILPRIQVSNGGSGDWTSLMSSSSDKEYNADDSPKQVSGSSKEYFKTANRSTIVSTIGNPPIFQSFLDSESLDAKRHTLPLLNDVGRDDTAEKGHPLRSTDANRQLRQQDVMRKVNSGFEVLRPGTLGTRKNSSDSTSIRTQKPVQKSHRKTQSESTTGRKSQLAEDCPSLYGQLKRST
ncbi:hypothetical protein MMC26_004093 [Xylographa opegraphella]|nr:hypothetical protein [Xylographa opegraphella]